MYVTVEERLFGIVAEEAGFLTTCESAITVVPISLACENFKNVLKAQSQGQVFGASVGVFPSTTSMDVSPIEVKKFSTSVLTLPFVKTTSRFPVAVASSELGSSIPEF